jgi:hypothetical protein
MPLSSPRRFTALIAAGLAALQLHAAPASAQAPASSPHFETVRQRLELGGPLYVYVDVDGDVARIGRDVSESIASVVGNDPRGQYLKLDYEAILSDLGLTQIKALGMSSSRRAQGGYVNRGFVYIPEPRRGLLTLFGGPARPFATARMAPADTDLFIEAELDASTLLQTVSAVGVRLGFPDVIEELFKVARREGGAGDDQLAAATLALDFVRALKGRVTLALGLGSNPRLDPQAPEAAAMELATNVKLLLRVEGIGEKLVPLLSQTDELVASTVGNRRIYRLKESLPFLGDNQPVLAIEGTTALLASSLAHLDQSLSRTAGLDTAPAFRSGLEALGPEGNSVNFFTPRMIRFLKDAVRLATKVAADMGEDRFTTSMIEAALGMLPDSDQPLMTVSANVADGILLRAHSPLSLKNALLTLGIYNPETMGMIARIAAPAIARAVIADKSDGDGTARAVVSPQDAAIQENLQRIAEVAERYFKDNPGEDEVAFDELEPSLAGLRVVAGEDYSDVTVTKGAPTIEVELPNGRTVAYAAPLSDGDRAQIRRNLRAFDEAAAWYLASRPNESFMAGNEATEDGSPMKAAPKPVRGENYNSLAISRDDTEIKIEVAGETIVVERDMARAERMKQEIERHGQLVEKNLARLYDAARQAFDKDRNLIVVRGRALIGPGKPIPSIERVAGEPYENVIVWRNYAAVSLNVPGRGRVVHRAELTDAQLEVINGHLRAIARAAGNYFQRNPNDAFVVSGELMGSQSKPIQRVPIGAFGEDYTDIVLERDFEEVKIRLPSGQVVTVDRQR